MDNVLLQVLATKLGELFGWMLLGALIAKTGWLQEKNLKRLAFSVTDLCMPCLFFLGMLRFGRISLINMAFSMTGALSVSLIGLGLGLLALRWSHKNLVNKGTFLFLCSVGNSSFLPFPLALGLWGQPGGIEVIQYVLFNNIYQFTVGFSLLRQGNLKRPELKGFLLGLLHPQVLAACLGLGLSQVSSKPPAWLLNALNWPAQATIPLAMVVIGALLLPKSFKTLEIKGEITTVAFLKLLALPALAFLIMKSLGLKGLSADIVMLQATMPCLASTAAYTQRFGGDPKLAAQAAFLTTLLSFGTIWAWMWLWM